MFGRLLGLVSMLITLLFGFHAEARTWVVAPDGSGDAPTIQAAIDSTDFNGDVIMLLDGVFSGPGNRDLYNQGRGFAIVSQSGNPEDCIIDCEGSPEEPHGGIGIHEDG